jgi:hypothetical protein
MIFSLAANALVLIHLGFILFVVLGGFLLLRWPRMVWIHLPAVIWGALVEINNWICPLTPWEQQLRQAAGSSGYQGGFVEHYLLPVIYPEGITDKIQLVLGLAVILINLVFYGRWLHHRMAKKRTD